MNILKSRALKIVTIAACLVALALGIFFALPARTANADEFVPEETKTVSDEQALLSAVQDAGSTPTLIKLDANIELQTSEVRINSNQAIAIDLNGHTLSRDRWVIVNWWGNLYLQDSSSEQTGKVESLDDSNTLTTIFNYGNLTTSVDICAGSGVDYAITNELALNNSNEYVCNPSLTILKGTIEQKGVSYTGSTLINVVDGDVLIKDGTFISGGYQGTSTYLVEVSSTLLEPDYYPEPGVDYSEGDDGNYHLTEEAQQKVDDALAALDSILDNSHRHSKVTIEGGDFTAFGPQCSVFSVEPRIEKYTSYYAGRYGAYWQSSATDPYDAEVTVKGGTWGRDVSNYLVPGNWLVENPDGKDTYIIQPAQEEKAYVDVTADGQTYSLNSFSAAWSTAVIRASAGKDTTLKLKKNCEMTTLNFPDSTAENATITIDLNGFTLSITQSSVSNYHIYGRNGSTGQIKLVVQDKSDTQSGVLDLVYLNNAQKGGIYISRYSKFVLESGTIRRTGGPLKTVGSYSSSSKGDEYKAKAYRTLFTLSPVGSISGTNITSKFENEMVVIKGGNILSEIDESQWDDGDHALSFVCFEYCYNNYPSYCSTQYCLKFAPLDEYDIKEDTYNPTFRFQSDERQQIFKFDLEALDSYLDGEGKGCRFSWDLSVLAPDLVWAESNGGYIVTKQNEGDNFSANGVGCATFADALQKAQKGDTILVLNPDLTVDDEDVVLDGVTLDLNTYLRHTITFTHGLTLKNGAAIKNGTVTGGGVIVDAHDDGGKSAYFDNAELQCDLTVNTNADLVISEGKYAGSVTVQGGANLLITGGSFNGSAIDEIDPYFGFALGAYIAVGEEYVDGTMYDVKIAPDLDAQKWYENNKDNEAFQVSSPDEWNYFAVYVNSGVDTFQGKKVELTGELKFGGNPSGVSLFAAREAQTPFLPAGNATHRFNGSFDGHNLEISGIVAKEMYVGLFGYMGNGTLSNINLKNSKFTVGNGYLDEFNKSAGYLAGSAITGESVGAHYENLSIEGVTVDYDITGYNIFSGAVLGHTYATTTVDTLKMRDTSVNANWKLGGVVGFYEESFTLRNADIGGVEIGEDSLFAPGVVAGHANGNTTTLEDCKVDAPNDSLIGTSYNNRSKNVTITGAETDIHVESLGAEATDEVKVELSKNEETGKSSQVQFSAAEGKLPSNLTITDSNGETIVENGETVGDGPKVDPEDGSLVFEAAPQVVDLYTGSVSESSHTGSYATLQEALAAAQPGDRIYLQSALEESSVEIGEAQNVTINLNGFTLTGKITVKGTLTLENGTVTGSVVVDGGELILAMGENGLSIDNSGAGATAVTGDYTVDEDICVRVTDTTLELASEHDFTKYTVDENVITVSCEHDGAVKGTITLSADDFTYDGKEHPATVVVDGLDIADPIQITYMRKNAADEYEPFSGVPVESGSYKASITVEDVTVSVEFSSKRVQVVVGGIESVTAEYSGSAVTVEVGSFTLTSLSGDEFPTTGKEIHVTITIEESKYQAGEYTVALITSISLGGEYANNFELSLIGQQAFTKLTVNQVNLYVSIDKTGKVSYDGFVGGEDESVLGGKLVMTYDEDGAVHLSGLESNNYNIIYRDGVVLNTGADLTALWVILGALAAITTVAAVTIAVKKSRRK